MIFKNRQRPIAFLICSGFASIIVASYGLEACAQAPTALRVDPVLLGLPPAPAAEKPAEPKALPETPKVAPEPTHSPATPAPRARPESDKTSAPPAPIKPEAEVNAVPVAAESVPVERSEVSSEAPSEASLPPVERPVSTPVSAPLPIAEPEKTAEPVVSETSPASSESDGNSKTQSETLAPIESREMPYEPVSLAQPEATPALASPASPSRPESIQREKSAQNAQSEPNVQKPESSQVSRKAERQPVQQPGRPVRQPLRQTAQQPVMEEAREPEPSPKEMPTQPIAPAPAAPITPVVTPPTQVTEQKARVVSPPAKMLNIPRENIVSLGELKVDPALLGGEPIKKPVQTVTAAPIEAVGTEPEVTPVRETSLAAVSAPDRQANRRRSPVSAERTVDDTEEPVVVAAAEPMSAALPEAHDQAEPLGLRFSRVMSPLPKEDSVPRPVFINSKRMHGVADQEFVAEEEAELRKVGTVLTADKLTYWPVEDEVEAEGNARLEQGEDLVTGPKMRMRLEDKVGFIDQATYRITRQSLLDKGGAEADEMALNELEMQAQGQTESGGFWNSGFVMPGTTPTPAPKQTTVGYGEADRIDFEGENQIRLTNATYSTCPPGNTDWFVKARDLQLDYDNEVGKGSDGTVYFMGAPILYTPTMSFSLNNERKSGFLPPKFGTSSDSGFQFSIPYYWNIAPNMDATLTPHVMSKRGLMLGSEWRYLNSAFGGLYNSKVTADFLPNDSQRDNDNRYGFAVKHTQTTGYGLSADLDYNKVSDDNYFTDLASGVTSTSSTQLLQRLMLSYSGGGWWSTTVNFQQHQTLQPDPDNFVRESYKMLPQITVNARKPDLYLTDMSFLGQYTDFKRDDQYDNNDNLLTSPNAKRTVLYPQIALPYTTPGWYVTPKVGANIRHYSISNRNDGGPDSVTTTLPVFSVDSGMTFERKSNWFGKDYLQTLEPRLYYVNIPYKDQSEIPIFDSGLADFNFAQIFSENQFSGWDRVNNANQLTAAVTSRLLDSGSGQEIMRGLIGQRYYFSRNRVSLYEGSKLDVEDRKWDRSDILAAFSGQVLPGVFADTALQYGISDNELKRYSIGGRYNPEPGKVLNAAYRYNRDELTPVDQIDVSGQWPLYGGWHGVGRVNYSFKDDASTAGMTSQSGRMVEAIAGLEYNGGCWVVRGVVQRLALTHDKSSTAFFIQLELNDFARIGSSPLDLLKRNIQGYRMVNDSSVAN